jgi:hypothetical protein
LESPKRQLTALVVWLPSEKNVVGASSVVDISMELSSVGIFADKAKDPFHSEQ